MYSAKDNQILLRLGCPIRKSSDLSLFSSSPKLIAASHVLHRLLTPRHPPCALSSLTIILRDYSSYTTKLRQKITFVIIFPHIQLSKSKLKHEEVVRYWCEIPPHVLTFGGKRARTAGPLRAKQVLSQLSYTPDVQKYGPG
jgi:hypothetical protein